MKNTLCELLDQATILGHRKTNKEIAEYLESCGVIVCRQDEIPAADVQPVKRGVWKEYTVCENRNNGTTHIYEYSEDYMTCSNCWHSFNYCDNDTERFNYCPNCGAKMESEDK